MKLEKRSSIVDVIELENIRYRRKGYGIVVASIIVFCWFLVVPRLSHYIWPKKIENEFVFYFLLTWSYHEIIFLICNFTMWVIYKLEVPFFERYKINDRQWPWNEDPQKWNMLIKETIAYLFLNQVLIVPIFSLISSTLNRIPYRMDYDSLPTCFEVIWQTVFCMITDDFFFYWVHRFLHWDKIYSYIHKVHHKHINTVSIASEFSHPIEFILTSMVVPNLSFLILGKKAHLFTGLLWLTLRVLETTDGHSGYEFSWSPFRLLPLSGSAEFHGYHHVSYKGNYGSFFTYMDKIFGTESKHYKEYIEEKKRNFKKNE